MFPTMFYTLGNETTTSSAPFLVLNRNFTRLTQIVYQTTKAVVNAATLLRQKRQHVSANNA